METNNLMITEMFEEIKSLLISMEKKLGNDAFRSSKLNPDIERRSPTTQPKVDLKKLEQIYKAIYAYLQNSDYKTSKTNQTIEDSEKHILSRLQEIKYSIETQEKERIVHHQHVVDLRSSKLVITMISLIFFLMLSVSANINQLVTNSKMKDNDLKYRYIKLHNGINSENLKQLEKAFDYPRNKKMINSIKLEVGGIEKK